MSEGSLYRTRREHRLCVDCGARLQGRGSVRCPRHGGAHRERQQRAEYMVAIREQAAFEAEQKANLHARIRKAAATNPDLPLEALSERFGYAPSYISRLIGGCAPERRENAYLGSRRSA